MAKRNSAQDVEILAPGAASTNGGATIDGEHTVPSPTDTDHSEKPESLDEDNPTGETPYDPPPVARRVSAYAVALGQLERVFDFMDLDADMRAYLRTCQRELIVHFPVQMDDGAIRMFTGFRVSLGIAWLAIVAAEMLTGAAGLGGFLWQEYNALVYEHIILCILTIGFVGFALDRLMSVVEARFKVA